MQKYARPQPTVDRCLQTDGCGALAEAVQVPSAAPAAPPAPDMVPMEARAMAPEGAAGSSVYQRLAGAAVGGASDRSYSLRTEPPTGAAPPPPLPPPSGSAMRLSSGGQGWQPPHGPAAGQAGNQRRHSGVGLTEESLVHNGAAATAAQVRQEASVHPPPSCERPCAQK